MNVMNNQNKLKTLLEIFLISTRLGLTSFGGPVAHLGYFHEEYIRRRKWMNERDYADLVALCQFLPGPASSQVGIGIGMIRGGLLGGIISFLGFTLPSVLVLILFAMSVQAFDLSDAGFIQGLKIVAVAVVAHAILGMGKKLAPDRERATIAIVSLVAILLWQTAWTQVAVIILAGLIGYLLYKDHKEEESGDFSFPLSKKIGAISLGLFFGLLFLLPILRELYPNLLVAMFDSFYRAGSLVFGGGHVVLPMLEREVVPVGWVSEDAFLAGYGAAQAVPGPLFTFASYLGAVISGWTGALVATVAIFLPAFLLIIGTLPFWNQLRQNKHVRGALFGVNAAVVGILIAAFYHPIFTSAIFEPMDFAFAAVLFAMLVYWKLPAWMIVIIGVLIGIILY
ncbi:chromate transporter [Bacillus shivajii]|uniref:chromate transporter n=1 Tax=Bacillus shivajii TaxID=1983719 RepID=UPI001CFB9FAD|nr:chromate transporter [Bacillus shivajii]UCZ54259.1 chromate transporter [Bacillus shivajii]